MDAVTRLLPGALGNEASSVQESFSEPLSTISRDRNSLSVPQASEVAVPDLYEDAAPLPEARHLLLDFPHYTRPADFRGWQVPEVLVGGNHEEIRRWRERMAVEKTRRNRPDLLDSTKKPSR
jgi:tRNA (guanine37-N1)-methyltransferase